MAEFDQSIPGNNRFMGGLGDDTYVFGVGSGQDTITDTSINYQMAGSWRSPSYDSVTFGPGITAGDLIFERSGDPEGKDLIIRIAGTGDVLVVEDQFLNNDAVAIEEFRFEDGMVIAASDVDAFFLASTDGDDAVFGTARDEVIAGGTGDDLLNGAGGNDIYQFSLGDGVDTIDETGQFFQTNILRLGSGITAGDLVVERTGERFEDLTITIGVGGDAVIIKGQVAWSHISSVEFADGSALTASQLLALSNPVAGDAGTGSYLNDYIVGSDLTGDRLDGRAGDDVLEGGDGDDTYIFGHGYGTDLVSDWGGYDVIEFGEGISFSDLSFSFDYYYWNVVAEISGSGDSIVFADYAIDALRFADGSEVTISDLSLGATAGTAGSDYLYYFGWSDVTINPGAGDDYIQLLQGQFATIHLDSGFGSDRLAISQSGGTPDDVVEFGAGLNFADAVLSREGRDLVVEFAGGDRLTIERHFTPNFDIPTGSRSDTGKFNKAPQIAELRFADGTVLTTADIANLVMQPTVGDDLIVASGNMVLDGGAGDDRLEGGAGDQSFMFGRGYGHDTVYETGATSRDSVIFTADILPSDLRFYRPDANSPDFVIEIVDTGETLTIERDAFYRDGRSATIEEFAFADGTVLTPSDIELAIWQAESTDGDDVQRAFGYRGYFNSSDGGFALPGSAGDDTILFGAEFAYLSVDGTTGHDVFVPVADETFESFSATQIGITVPDTLYAQLEFTAVTGNVGGYEGYHLRMADGAMSVTVASFFSPLGVYNSVDIADNFQVIAEGSGDRLRGSDIVSDLMATATSATSADDTVFASSGAELIDALAGDDLIFSLEGADTIAFGIGSGNDTIGFADSAGNFGEAAAGAGSDFLFFTGGLTLVDLAISWKGQNYQNLVFTLNATGETVSLYERGYYKTSVGSIQFGDGTVLSIDGLIDSMLAGTAGDDVIVSDSDGDVLNGLGGNDVLVGHAGSDIYVFGGVSGQSRVIEDDDYGTDVVQFGAGVTLSDISVERTGGDLLDLRITVNTTGAELIIENQFGSYDFLNYYYTLWSRPYGLAGVEEFRFDDGTVLTREQMANLVSGNDLSDANVIITGPDGGILAGGGDNDSLNGGIGGDTYLLDRGDGHDRIIDSGGYDIVQFGTNVLAGELQFSRAGPNGVDLLINIAGDSGSSLYLIDQFAGPASRVDLFKLADGTALTWEDIQKFILAGDETAGDDAINGFYSGDVISGGDGNDSLRGLEGDDTLDGGAGADTAVYSGAQSDYDIQINGNTVIVTHLGGGADGTDTLTGVEAIYFEGDGTTMLLAVSSNTAPVANDDGGLAANEDEALVIAPAVLIANDADAEGDPLSIVSVQGATNGTVMLDASGNIVFTPQADYSGPASFTYTISDGEFTSTASVSLNIDPVNDPPVAVADSGFSTNEDEPLVLAPDTLLFNDWDSDGDTLTISSVQDAVGGAVTIDGSGNVVFTPDADYNGAAPFRYTVTDGSLSSTATVNVTVDPVNDAPIAIDDMGLATAMGVGSVIAQSVLLSNDMDIDGDALQVVEIMDAVNCSAELDENGDVVFMPMDGFSGPAQFEYKVSDGEKTAIASVEVMVVNAAGESPDAGDDEGFSVETYDHLMIDAADLLANDTDPDGGALTIVSVKGGDGGQAFIADSGEIAFFPNPGYTGPATFTYTVEDESGMTSEATVFVDVLPSTVYEEPNGGDLAYGRGGGNGNGHGHGKGNGKGRGDEHGIGNGKADEGIVGGENMDVIHGRNGHDALYGDDAGDRLIGGRGDDMIHGGPGNDVLRGGWGDDEYWFTVGDGNDTIKDFDWKGDDLIVLWNHPADIYEDVLNAALQDGANTVIDFGEAGSITLKNFNLADLGEEDFQFI